KAAFLYVGDIRENFEEGFADPDREEPLVLGDEPESVLSSRTPIQDLLNEGQHIMVQVAKDPIGTKGARLTTHISLPGRFVVYLPSVRHLGISRRIEGEA